jgi:hypothetical protein
MDLARLCNDMFMVLTLRSGSGGDDYPDDYEPYIDTSMYPGCVTNYTTFKELDDHKDSIPAHCMEQNIFNVEVAVMEAALEKYKDLVNNGTTKSLKSTQATSTTMSRTKSTPSWAAARRTSTSSARRPRTSCAALNATFPNGCWIVTSQRIVMVGLQSISHARQLSRAVPAASSQ